MNIADARLSPGAADSVTALYTEHALGLVRLAVVLTGDRAAAEDIVQDAFLGLYRRWDKLPEMNAPLAYLRVSVINGCRTAMRRRSRLTSWPPQITADGNAITCLVLDMPAATPGHIDFGTAPLAPGIKADVKPKVAHRATIPPEKVHFGVAGHGTYTSLPIPASMAASVVTDITF